MIYKARPIFFILSVCFFFSACDKRYDIIGDFDKYQNVLIDRSSHIPTEAEIEDGKTVNVVIGNVEFEGIANSQTNKSEIIAYIKATLAEALSRNKYIKVLNRDFSSKLQDEIKLKKIKGNFDYTGPVEAEYAIFVNVTNLSMSSRLDANSGANVALGLMQMGIMAGAISAQDGGLTVIAGNPMGGVAGVSPTYEYTNQISMNLGIVDLRTMQEIILIPIDASRRMAEDAPRGNGGVLPPKTFDGNLAAAVIKAGIESKMKTILNTLPIRAYIDAKRQTKKGKTIFRITAGTDQGIRQNWNLFCEIRMSSLNQLTGAQEDTILRATGVTTNVLSAGNAWILLDDDKLSRTIKLGAECYIAPDARRVNKFG